MKVVDVCLRTQRTTVTGIDPRFVSVVFEQVPVIQYQSVPLDPIEFTDMFGKPTTEDLEIITQVFIKDYLLWSDKEDENLLYNKWGGDWIMELLKFNEDREEYELCSIMLESYKKCNRYFKTMYNKNKVK